jgi:subtilisin family serine protease
MTGILLSSPRPNAFGRSGLASALAVVSLLAAAPVLAQPADAPEKAAGAVARPAFNAAATPDPVAGLHERVRGGKSARVVALLRGVPMNQPATATAVAGTQDRLARRLWNRGNSMPGWRAYRNVPAIAMEVDEKGLADLQIDPEVAAVQEDRLARPDLSVSGPLVSAPTSWNFGHNGSGSAVAILDTGVDRNHPFFGGRVVHEACFSTNYAPETAQTLCPNGQEQHTGTGAAQPCTAESGCFHGTHVAGIAAGYQSDSFAGVAKAAQIIAINVFSRFSGAQYCGAAATCIASYTSDQMRALDYLLTLTGTYRVAAANMSLGGGAYTSQVACDSNNAALKQTIDTLRNAGIATVIAAGNDGYLNAVSEPGCISSAVSAGNTENNDKLHIPSNIASFVTLMAPGTSIRSSIPNGAYGTATGTSMSTPHIAGAIAILKSVKPSATVSEIVGALRNGGKMLTVGATGSSGTSYMYDIPRLDVAGAVARLCTSCMAPVTGWWWNPAEAGRGFSLETNNGRMYLGAYLYDTDGTPMWLSAAGTAGSGNSISGSLAKYGSGQTLGGTYQQPQLLGVVGTATVSFTSPTVGTLTWPGGTISIQRFPIDGQATVGSPSGAPQTGWWWNPAQSGTGWFFEVQGSNIFISGYMYDSAGRPVWYVSSGPMINAAAFDGSLQVYGGGQTLTGSYQAPSSTAAVGQISLRFDGAATATLTLPNGQTLTLTRFSNF